VRPCSEDFVVGAKPLDEGMLSQLMLQLLQNHTRGIPAAALLEKVRGDMVRDAHTAPVQIYLISSSPPHLTSSPPPPPPPHLLLLHLTSSSTFTSSSSTAHNRDKTAVVCHERMPL
jgi:hypothetical protein